jgi:hypothetical protein
MVRALLDGRKSQTRRVLKPQPWLSMSKIWNWEPSGKGRRFCSWDGPPYIPITDALPMDQIGISKGDFLWVRETWTTRPDLSIAYRASVVDPFTVKWCSPRYMPRSASRITLEVTGVKVERLHDISEEDCDAEGIDGDLWDQAVAYRNYEKEDGWFCMWGSDDCYTEPGMYVNQDKIRSASFRSLWDSIHGPDAWKANPWVYCLEFITIKANIDDGLKNPATLSGM